MTWILTLIAMAFLMLLHEGGHAIGAYFLGYRVERLALAPGSIFPYISVRERGTAAWRRLVFLASGTLMTLLLFGLGFSQSFWGLSWLYYALVLQLLFETNPFFSDWSMMLFRNELRQTDPGQMTDLKSKIQEFWYSPKWYLHFFSWGLFAMLLLSVRTSIS
jgi:hypothetical protein